MPFKFIKKDITKVKADAIVLAGEAGSDAVRIYEENGAEVEPKERKEMSFVKEGEAVASPATALPAKYIIHTTQPAWVDGNHGEWELLASCYEKALSLAEELSCKKIAFPLLAAEDQSFPKERVWETALSVIGHFLRSGEMEVILAVSDRKAVGWPGESFRDMEAYIGEHFEAVKPAADYSIAEALVVPDALVTKKKEAVYDGKVEKGTLPEPEKREDVFLEAEPGASLEDALAQLGETFQQRLFALIDERGLSDVEVYKKANLDRKLFSKIRCNTAYRPKKKTALALAIALELSEEETVDLLNRAELALSPSSISDLIIRYFIEKREYDIYQINTALFYYHQPILGG